MVCRRTAISSFPRAVIAMFVLGLAFLPVARFSRWLLSNCSHCSLLEASRLEQLPDNLLVGPVVLPSTLFSTSWHKTGCKIIKILFLSVRAHYLECPVLLYLRTLLCCYRFLLPFRKGPTPPQCPLRDFTLPHVRNFRLFASRPPALRSFLRSCRVLSYFPHVAPVSFSVLWCRCR
jgi:hypothetical protein